MFQLINNEHNKFLIDIIGVAAEVDIQTTAAALDNLIERIRADIPEKKRISYGRYTVIKQLGLKIYPMLEDAGTDTFGFAFRL